MYSLSFCCSSAFMLLWKVHFRDVIVSASLLRLCPCGQRVTVGSVIRPWPAVRCACLPYGRSKLGKFCSDLISKRTSPITSCSGTALVTRNLPYLCACQRSFSATVGFCSTFWYMKKKTTQAVLIVNIGHCPSFFFSPIPSQCLSSLLVLLVGNSLTTLPPTSCFPFRWLYRRFSLKCAPASLPPCCMM